MRLGRALELRLHLLDFRSRGPYQLFRLRRAWSLEARDSEVPVAILQARPAYLASTVPPLSIESARPISEGVKDVVDLLEALQARGSALDVTASTGMSNIPDINTLLAIEECTRLVLDAEWTGRAPGRFSHSMEIVDCLGIVGSDAGAYCRLVEAVRACCADTEPMRALRIFEDAQSYHLASRKRN
jgi:hypothetical protein